MRDGTSDQLLETRALQDVLRDVLSQARDSMDEQYLAPMRQALDEIEADAQRLVDMLRHNVRGDIYETAVELHHHIAMVRRRL